MPATTTSADCQIRAYAGLRAMEARAQTLEDTIAAIKRRCLHGGPGVVEAIGPSVADLRTQLRQLDEQAEDLEQALCAASQGAPLPDRRREERQLPGMRGTTDVLSVADLMGFLSSVKKTGTLTLQSDESLFVFEFQGGAIVHAATSEAGPELRLGTILVAQNKITEDQLKTSLEVSARTRELLGDQLLRSSTVAVADLRQALEVQVGRIFEQAFRIQHGRFVFLEGSLSDINERVSLSTMQLLLEAARSNDERQRQAAGGSPSRQALDTILPD